MTYAALLARVRAWPARMRLLAAGGFALLIALGAAGFVASRDSRVPLFSAALRPDQLAEVETRLAAWGVAYAPAADNVRVPRAKRPELLLRLALAGLPRAHLSGSGEALAHAGALTPQTVLEAQTRDALAADLALALRGVDGILDARIVIAPSASGVYADEPRRDATAAVRLTLAPGARPASRTVSAIKAFVAGGVPGLDADRVTVLDDAGALSGDDDGANETDVQAALQSALDGAFGAGATIVRVHREPLGERRDVHDVRRAALEGSLARTTSDERYASGPKRYSKTSATEDRGSATRDEHRVAGPQTTARLTVAIFVDAARALDVAKIRALAAATAGVRADRGDVLTVEAVAFASGHEAAGDAPRVPAWLAVATGLLPQALTALALVVVVALAAKPFALVAARALEAASARGAAREAAAIPPERVREALRDEPPHVAAAIIASLPAPSAAAVLELYAGDERTAIVRRLPHANRTLLPTAAELLGER
ncbi:MAG TPA: flagellar M-ring protein FliF C-terminal domain-containing protein [Candidatus Elarobacter sp.]|jgi:flagellar M-ring protein FliF|nr:flagellar M-ring protein FliF C-terminal domain-containing protein [Candidatus Elarobacter sp.]